MTSPARAAANAANAQLSTGPRTEPGKARSSRNAVSHGLACSQNFIMPGEEAAFTGMHDALLIQLAPADGVEMLQFELALHAAWGLRRCRLIEMSLMDAAAEFDFDDQAMKSLERLQRYSAHHQRAFDRSLKMLSMMQTERLARRAAEGHQDPIPELVPVAQVDKRARQIAKRTQPLVLVAGAAKSPVSTVLQNEPIAAADPVRQQVA